MIYIEPHIHMLSRTTDDYQRMYAAGIRVAVEPSFWLGTPRRYPGTFLDYFQLILEGETERARKFGIDHYANIAVNPKEAEDLNLARETIAMMEDYWNHPRCLAVGEIGFNNITENEEKVFVEQLRIGLKRNMPIMIHTPHIPKLEGTKRSVEICKAEGAPHHLVLIDHNTEQTMPVSYPAGYWCGMTVYPYSKLSIERVIAILREWGVERMMVNSSADWGVSDPCNVVNVARAMLDAGFSEADVRKLTFENPRAFYSQNPRFQCDLNIPAQDPAQFQRLP